MRPEKARNLNPEARNKFEIPVGKYETALQFRTFRSFRLLLVSDLGIRISRFPSLRSAFQASGFIPQPSPRHRGDGDAGRRDSHLTAAGGAFVRGE